MMEFFRKNNHERKFLLKYYLPNWFRWQWNRSLRSINYLEQAALQRWVFILGCNNSGTKILHNLLAAHPEIGYLPDEGSRLTRTLLRPGTIGLDRIWTERIELFRLTEKDTIDPAARLIHDWLNYISNPKAKMFLEKSPVNCLRARWLQRIFKKSYFVGLTRDGRAVAEGISRRKDYEVSILRGAVHWNKVYSILLDDAKHLDRFRWVKYEDLTSDPEKQIRKLLDFIRLDPNDYDFSFKRQQQIMGVDGLYPGIENFNKNSFARISPDDLRHIAKWVEPVMSRLGYRNNLTDA